MYRSIVIFVVSSLLFGCGQEFSSETTIPDDIEYNIIKDEKKRDIKRQIEVSLNRKVSRDVLKEIALNLKQRDSKSYQRTFIGYFLAGKNRNNGYGFWATTNFNRNLEVKIYGLSIEDERVLTKKAEPKPERIIIGSWLDDRTRIMGKRITLFYTNETLFLERTYLGGNSEITEMTERSENGGRRIDTKDGNEFGLYFLINPSNELEFWTKNDNHYTARRLP